VIYIVLIDMNSDNKIDKKSFEITHERIDTLNKAASYIGTIGDFACWCANNYDSIDIEESYYIIEDFVISNKHIVQKISKVRSS
jgi:hypothetical protein